MAQESQQKSSPARKRGPSLIFMLATMALIAVPLLAAQQPFDYFRNSWNVVGLKDYERGTASGVKVDFTPPQREQPEKIILHLPKSRPLEGTLKGIKVIYRPDQKKRWDFETVVRLYQEKALALFKD